MKRICDGCGRSLIGVIGWKSIEGETCPNETCDEAFRTFLRFVLKNKEQFKKFIAEKMPYVGAL